MELQVIQKLVDSLKSEHGKFTEKVQVAERYYQGDNDILKKRSPSNEVQNQSKNPLRVADNRITHNWHGLLVNQKVAYMFTYPPLFDTGDKELNEAVIEVLGDEYPKECSTLGVNADNCGLGWLHVWIDETNTFQYANVDPKQIIPIYSNDLKKRLIAVLRTYQSLDDTGEEHTIYEYWTDKECYRFSSKDGYTNSMVTSNSFEKKNLDTGNTEQTNVYLHNFGEVPFIEFPNNSFKTSNLDHIKKLIDVYDKVFSGYVNDIEDIQEVIFVLTNYGGTDLDEFLGQLKRYKAIDLQNDGEEDKSGLSPMTIDIPVEARNKLLEITRKAIFVQGQGIDPERQEFGNVSGVALKFVYSLLELKAGITETEFRLGFGRLVRMIAKHLGKPVKKLTQTWTRNMITNDIETAEIAERSKDVISNKSIVANHPWTTDIEVELAQMEEDMKKRLAYDQKVMGTDSFIQVGGIDGEEEEQSVLD